MKKFFLSLLAVATLFSACSSDDSSDDSSRSRGAGVLKTTISFSGNELKATAATGSIPNTSWANIKQMHVILYQKGGADDGKVAFSNVITTAQISAETGIDKTFNWGGVPAGTYRLAIVANTGASDAIQGKAGATDLTWTANSLINKKFGPAAANPLFLDFKKATAFPADYNTDAVAAGNVAYQVPSEVFTVYTDNVVISEGQTTTVGSPTSLKLKREVALFRTRIDKSSPLVDLTKIEFNNAKNFMLVQRLPNGLGIKTEAYAGGVFTTSDVKKVLVAKTGVDVFSTTPPSAATHSNPTQILNSKFTYWNEFVIFPNHIPGSSAALDPSRKYTIVLSAFAQAGYEAEDGVVPAGGDNVYWEGTLNDSFEPNIIREVNITITSKGTIAPPVTPTPIGGLNITVGQPLPWDSNIKVTDTEI